MARLIREEERARQELIRMSYARLLWRMRNKSVSEDWKDNVALELAKRTFSAPTVVNNINNNVTKIDADIIGLTIDELRTLRSEIAQRALQA